MTGELLRQSHLASGFDAGKSLLAAENERLKAQVEAMQEVVGAAEALFKTLDEPSWDAAEQALREAVYRFQRVKA